MQNLMLSSAPARNPIITTYMYPLRNFYSTHLKQFLGAVAEVDGLPVLGRLLLPVVGEGVPARDLLLAAALVGGRAHTNLPV